MSKIGYLDCSSGISGDMFIAAFLDAGLGLDRLNKEIRKLGLKDYRLKASKVKRGHLYATKFDIEAERRPGHSHMPVKSIISMISRSGISDNAKDMACRIYKNLELSEKKIHRSGKAVDLHELGDIDSIIDIAGAAVSVDEFGLDGLYFSNITFGRGIVRTRSGPIPVPSPATVDLLRGVTARFSDIGHELVTPTGAAILKTIARPAETPVMKIERVGYGAGSRDLKEAPNALRLIVGSAKKTFLEDSVSVIETAIDDMSPALYGYVFEKLFEAGALDVYITPVYMKKQRPGHLLTVVAEKDSVRDMAEIIFRETTTLGLRFYDADRLKLERRSSSVPTRYGDVSVKIGKTKSRTYNVMPEYESLKKIAKKKIVPMKEVYNSAIKNS